VSIRHPVKCRCNICKTVTTAEKWRLSNFKN